MTRLRGVNLGGWLVLERWMTPSVFAGTDARDEYGFMHTPGAAKTLAAHHRTFIQEEDFRWIAEHGLNAVRIPIGYWVFGDEPPYASSIDHLDWAIKMARKYDLKVLIDLHGAPGSQNGNDHSGKIGQAEWFDSSMHQTQTIAVLVRLAERYKSDDTVWGIELLNEPDRRLRQPVLRDFYRSAYDEISRVARPGLTVVFSDAFSPVMLSGALRQRPKFPVMMDTHWYHFMVPRLVRPYLPMTVYFWHLRLHAWILSLLARQQPIMVGEWSAVIAGEKMRRIAPENRAQAERKNIAVQLNAFRDLDGWFFWSYKQEGPGPFHFRSLYERGLIDDWE